MHNRKKMALISGVTSGVGEELTKAFISRGWGVVGIARNKEKLAMMRETLGVSFTGYSVDLKNKHEIEDCFKEIKLNVKSIDLLINNAAL